MPFRIWAAVWGKSWQPVRAFRWSVVSSLTCMSPILMTEQTSLLLEKSRPSLGKWLRQLEIQWIIQEKNVCRKNKIVFVLTTLFFQGFWTNSSSCFVTTAPCDPGVTRNSVGTVKNLKVTTILFHTVCAYVYLFMNMLTHLTISFVRRWVKQHTNKSPHVSA